MTAWFEMSLFPVSFPLWLLYFLFEQLDHPLIGPEYLDIRLLTDIATTVIHSTALNII